MKTFIPLDGFPGVWSRQLIRFPDDRGHFEEVLRLRDIEEFSFNIVQLSLSESRHNVARGLHSQENQWQIVTLIEGDIRDFILRPSAVGADKKAVIQLSAEGTNQLVIQPGIFHGFHVESKTAKIVYGSSVYYGDTRELGLNLKHHFGNEFDDSSAWILSERDRKFETKI
jgi:dTDP-4-dehydrorhamnose 3,5-epimerase-like enzyme